MFDRFLEMFRNISLSGILIIVGLIIVIILVAVLIARMRAKRSKRPSSTDTRVSDKTKADKWVGAPLYVSDKERKSQGKSVKNVELEIQYGRGGFKAMVYTKEGNIDFTTIPEPVGNIYQFETSLPFSGGGYIVKEDINGDIVEYAPSAIEIVTKELPEWAWFAIHCKDIVKRFWQVPAPWWHSVSMWFAAGMMLIVFISFLAVFGG